MNSFKFLAVIITLYYKADALFLQLLKQVLWLVNAYWKVLPYEMGYNLSTLKFRGNKTGFMVMLLNYFPIKSLEDVQCWVMGVI